jgi:hypothetical protein
MTPSVTSPLLPSGQGIAGPFGVSCSITRAGDNHNNNSTPTTTTRRNYWQEVIRQRPDRKTGKLKYEDPSQVVLRFQEHTRASDGATLSSIHLWNDRHEKTWMRKKRLASLRQYNQDKQNVLDLAKYIEFVQENNTTADKRDK